MLGNTLIEAAVRPKQLQSCPICSGLESRSLMAISEISQERTFEAGQFVMQEGEPSTGFFLVLSGKMRVYKSSASGKEKVLMIAQPGMTFGEDALFGEGLFLQNAVTMVKTRVLQIPRNAFLHMLREDPKLSFQVMESLCGWIRRLSSSVENVAFLSARDKVCGLLIDLYHRNKSCKFSLPGKKKEMADQLGLAPETFSRTLHDLVELNLIAIERRNIEILNFEELKGMTEA